MRVHALRAAGTKPATRRLAGIDAKREKQVFDLAAYPPVQDTARAAQRARFTEIREQTEALAVNLTAEDQTIQSMPDVSPTKWHLAHTSWFFETFLLGPALPGYQPFHELYGFLFNSYYEAVGPRWSRPERGLLSRPSLDEVLAYRRHVDDGMA